MEIIPNIHQISFNSTNVFLIIDEDGLTLIDTAMPFSAPKIARYIRSIGRDPVDLKRILITHADFDHVGSVRALKKLSGAKVYASKAAAEAMAEGVSSRELKLGKVASRVMSYLERIFHLPKVRVDEILTPGQVLPILGGLEVIDTPGHTPCHLSYFAKEVRVLFAGDSLHTRTGNINYNLHPSITWDRDKVIASTKLQKNLNPRVVCSGHGPVVYESEMEFPACP